MSRPSTPTPKSRRVRAPDSKYTRAVPSAPGHMGSHSLQGGAPPGYASPQPGEAPDFPSHPAPASAVPSLLQSQTFTVNCYMLPGQCLYFYSPACGLSLCGCGRRAGYFLLLCIFLLNWAFTSSPNSQFCLSWAVRPRDHLAHPSRPPGKERLTAKGCRCTALQPLRSQGTATTAGTPLGQVPWGVA